MLSASRRALGAAAIAAAAVAGSASVASAQAVNIYTTREPNLALPLMNEFSAATGIAVNTIFLNSSPAGRITQEGATSPADVALTLDLTDLADLQAMGLLQPVTSEALAAVPEALREPEGYWYAVSMGAAVIYTAADRVDEEMLTYEDLAGLEWAGRICLRAPLDPLNVSLVAAYIAKHGEAAAEQYVQDLQFNLARPAGGDDRDSARDILNGICDVAIGSSYYINLMRIGLDGPEVQAWAQAVRPIFATFDDGAGTHPMVAGVGIITTSPHPDQARAFVEYVLSPVGQEVLAIADFEYPVLADVALDPLTEGLGTFTPDPTPLAEIAANREAARRILEAAGLGG